MSLAPGTRFGVYDITAQIGEGGMGRVFRARDTTLNRDVALKVLPESFASDADRLARFTREAQTLASLNHPHIAAIYGLEESGGVRGLVMELVEGEDLSQRIARGAIPLDDAIPIAKQIADALEAAHDQGIIHRDLKPANVKVRPDGTVKVLDFGLAKALEGPGAAANVTHSPTMTAPAMTHAGMILGTAAYMAPEQARGRPVDRRADIWALGCVLFEMLSGCRAFPGEDVTDTLAAVVRAEPDWGVLPRSISPTLLVFLKRTLQKDPKQRVADIRDLRLALDGAFDVAPPAAAPQPASPLRGTRLAWLSFVVAALAALALAIPTLRHLGEVPSETPSLRLSIPVPPNSRVGFLQMSPDGKRLVAGFFRNGKSQLYVRALDALEWQVLPGTDNTRTPFWSPDSRFIGFFADGSLNVIPASGGPVRVVCPETGSGWGGTWGSSGVILLVNDRGQLRRVDAAGGACSPVGKDDGKHLGRLPVFLPDGRHFLFVDLSQGDSSSSGVYVASLDDLTPRKILDDPSGVVYAPPLAGGRAHLLFLRGRMLMAQPFDVGTLTAVGDPFSVASQATPTFTQPQVAASVSMGILVYLAGISNEVQLTWFDRSGKTLGTVGPRVEQANVALSPDGNSVVTRRRESNGVLALWLYDLVRGSESRFLLAGGQFGVPVWAPDSSRVQFRMSGPPTGPGVYEKARNGVGEPIFVSPIADTSFAPSSRSRDGRFLVYTLLDPQTQADIWYVQWDTKPDFGKALRFSATGVVESQGQLSPDGKWMAYTSNESGSYEIYVRQFPEGPGVWKISLDGGVEPRWNADGKQLYYLRSGSGDQQSLLSTAVEADGRGGLRIGTPQKLFDFRNLGNVVQSNNFTYSPHPDGRFLVNTQAEEGESTITVVTNWQQTIADRKTP